MPPESDLPPAAKKNVDTIAQVEQQLLRRRSRMERVGEAIARFFGSLLFIIAHVAFFAAWFLINAGRVRGAGAFDPYPFPFLSLVVGIEFIFLTTFVLINQKHEIRRNEQWAHLHLQLSMLTEQEVTKNMQMLDQVCRRLGIRASAGDAELAQLSQPTPVAAFVGELEKSRESGPAPATLSHVREMEKELINEAIEGAEERKE